MASAIGSAQTTTKKRPVKKKATATAAQPKKKQVIAKSLKNAPKLAVAKKASAKKPIAKEAAAKKAIAKKAITKKPVAKETVAKVPVAKAPVDKAHSLPSNSSLPPASSVNSPEPVIPKVKSTPEPTVTADPEPEADTATKTSPKKEATKKKQSAKLDVIVIDAGHGGRDPGAIGPNGYREKDATLAIALQLGKLIEKELPKVKVVYTRKDDSFVELYRRGQIANQKKGKLFISIHCNSTPQKPSKASGFASYILRPGKTDAAINVAARENAVIKYEEKKERYYYLSDVDFILTSMARSQDVKYSEKFAGLVQSELEKTLDIKNNGVSQAGFYVLVGASMPNALIETGFISNPTEEQLLKSPSGQLKYAKGILAAIKKYKLHYED